MQGTPVSLPLLPCLLSPFLMFFKTQVPPAGNPPSAECPRPFYSSSTPVEIYCVMLWLSVPSETFPSSPRAPAPLQISWLAPGGVEWGSWSVVGPHCEPRGRFRGFPGQVAMGKAQDTEGWAGCPGCCSGRGSPCLLPCGCFGALTRGSQALCRCRVLLLH